MRISRLGFAIVKLQVCFETHFLMRHNLKWGDISFIGGHHTARDNEHLGNTARRELVEEVPSFREMKDFSLKSITETISHGPVFSKSALANTLYEMKFFLVEFSAAPEPILLGLGPRTENVLIPQKYLHEPTPYSLSAVVDILDQAVVGGMKAIPMSWPANLRVSPEQVRHLTEVQFGLALK